MVPGQGGPQPCEHLGELRGSGAAGGVAPWSPGMGVLNPVSTQGCCWGEQRPRVENWKPYWDGHSQRENLLGWKMSTRQRSELLPWGGSSDGASVAGAQPWGDGARLPAWASPTPALRAAVAWAWGEGCVPGVGGGLGKQRWSVEALQEAAAEI